MFLFYSYKIDNIFIFRFVLWYMLMVLLCYLLDYLQRKNIYTFIDVKD